MRAKQYSVLLEFISYKFHKILDIYKFNKNIKIKICFTLEEE
ncbi:hypothetical protein QEW_1035 [Clostridioides difficile CD160]|nr:hypothetical protein QEW_1035 [Clostridioides difficile CD160]